MNRIIWFLMILLCPVIIVSMRTGAGDTAPYYHREGNEIIDPEGKPFQIRGANVSCWLYQENYTLGGAQTAQKVTAAKITGLIGEKAYLNHLKNMMDSFLVAEDIRMMKKLGVNCVRLGFDAVLFNNDSTKKWFFKSIDRLLPVFRENNIAILPIMMVPPAPPDNLWCTGFVKGDTLLWDSPKQKRGL